MICVELSSVHTTFDDNINDAILHAIFADGCAAAVLKGARKSECPKVSVEGEFFRLVCVNKSMALLCCITMCIVSSVKSGQLRAQPNLLIRTDCRSFFVRRWLLFQKRTTKNCGAGGRARPPPACLPVRDPCCSILI